MRTNSKSRTIRGAPTGMSFSISFQHPFNRAGGRASNVRQENKNMIKYTFLLSTVLVLASCKRPGRPVLAGGYESRKVRVLVNHKGGGGGGAIDTDQGVSERLMNLSGTESGHVKHHYKVVKVTPTGFSLEYDMVIENPLGSKPLPFSGTILVPYKDKVIHPITGDYTLTVWVQKFDAEQIVAHQPAKSFSISFQHSFNRAGGRTSNVRQR